jgi:hypothetical protein
LSISDERTQHPATMTTALLPHLPYTPTTMTPHLPTCPAAPGTLGPQPLLPHLPHTPTTTTFPASLPTPGQPMHYADHTGIDPTTTDTIRSLTSDNHNYHPLQLQPLTLTMTAHRPPPTSPPHALTHHPTPSPTTSTPSPTTTIMTTRL